MNRREELPKPFAGELHTRKTEKEQEKTYYSVST